MRSSAIAESVLVLFVVQTALANHSTDTDNSICVESNEEFKTCGSACPATCENMGDRNLICNRQCVHGCFCKDGFVRDSNTNQCVLPQECPGRSKRRQAFRWLLMEIPLRDLSREWNFPTLRNRLPTNMQQHGWPASLLYRTMRRWVLLPEWLCARRVDREMRFTRKLHRSVSQTSDSHNLLRFANWKYFDAFNIPRFVVHDLLQQWNFHAMQLGEEMRAQMQWRTKMPLSWRLLQQLFV